ncbi:eukaryotic mitochondrial regulator protein-domain-containing protein [Rhodocollybia butyracea]|uniref:Eukaryotic mitochondrial regulator protein-domain-containing protein n=1 Tax=Rhodocollybia butyracea TaxID=206335 RepID=A0A9P5Q4M9_9AGAR|nr:eukaryotic mitochondrial regulator protein-domain-containing protein [Rhodocollybia butyracea]
MNGIGERYKLAQPIHWLGSEVPFPLNKSFKPPPPISDAQRSEMYRLYMTNPQTNSVRALSQKFHISLDRVDAILRLKGMEEDFVKGNQLQTGFVKGMERLLGVPRYNHAPKLNTRRASEWAENEDDEMPERKLTLEELRHDVHEADMLEEAERNDPARQRYQRMYWESLPEFAGSAIIPASLERSREAAKHLAAKAAELKNRQFLFAIPDTDTVKTPKGPVQISTKDGRPDIHFVDVGTKFLDVAAETKRLARIESRARFRAKKATEKLVA